MRLLRTRGINFQSLKQFDVKWPEGAVCIVGENMSGKTTTARAPIWCLCGRFPYPDLKAFTKDMVVPSDDSSDVDLDDNDRIVRVKKTRADKRQMMTSVETTVAFPAPAEDGGEAKETVWRITRAQYGQKTQLILEDEAQSLRLYDARAQEQILNLAKIPHVGSTTDRVKMLMRKMWFGVGQDTSFFSAKGKDRRKILEAMNPFRKLPDLEREAGTRHKNEGERLKEMEKNLLELKGHLKAKRSDLSARLGAAGVNVNLVATEVEDDGDERLVEGLRSLTNKANEVVKELTSNPQNSPGALDAQISSVMNEMAKLSSDVKERERLESLRTEEKTLVVGHGAEAKSKLDQSLKDLDEAIALIEAAKADWSKCQTASLSKQALANGAEKTAHELDKLRAEVGLVEDAKIDLERLLDIAEYTSERLLPFERKRPKGDSAPDSFESLKRTGEAYFHFIRRHLNVNADRATSISIEKYRQHLDAKLKAFEDLDGTGELSKLDKTTSDTEDKLRRLNRWLSEFKAAGELADNLDERKKEIKQKVEAVKAQKDEAVEFYQRTKALIALASEISGPIEQAEGGRSGQLNGEIVAQKRVVFEQALYEAEIALDSPRDVVQGYLTQKNDRLKESEEKLSLTQELQKAARLALREAQDQLAALTQKIAHSQKRLDNLSKSLEKTKTVDSSEPAPPCDSCGAELSPEHLQRHSAELLSELEAMEKNKKELQKTITQREAQLDESNAVVKTQEKSVADLSSQIERLLLTSTEFLRSSGFENDVESCLVIQQAAATVASKDAEIEELSAQSALVSEAHIKKKEEASSLYQDLTSLLTKNEEDKTSLDFAQLKQLAETKERELREALVAVQTRREELKKTMESSHSELSDMNDEASLFCDALRNDGGQHVIQTFLVGRESELVAAIEALAQKLSNQKTELEAVEKSRLELDRSVRGLLSADEDEDIDAFIRLSIATLTDEKKALIERLDAEGKRQSALERLRTLCGDITARLPEAIQKATPEELVKLRSELEAKLRMANDRLAAQKRIGELRATAEETMLLLDRLDSIKSLVDETKDRLNSIAIIRGLLAPNGDARTLALSNDVATIVKLTNSFLTAMEFPRSLAVDLKLEKDEDQSPVIEIVFEVDGSSSGRILPSESQRHIVGLCTDIAVMKLGSNDGFIIVDEPETGLDDANKRKVSSFLMSVSPQTILITNNASAGFENIITTEQIRASSRDNLGPKDFAVDFTIKAAEADVKKDKAEAKRRTKATAPSVAEGLADTGEI